MEEKTTVAGKSYTLFTFLTAIDEAKDRCYDEAMKTAVVAVAGTVVCIDQGDYTCIDLLDEIVHFMERVSDNHPDHLLGQQRMLDALIMIISCLEKQEDNENPLINNALVRFLYRAMIAAEKAEQDSLAKSYERKALLIVRKLHRNKTLTCWLDSSMLYLHRSIQGVNDVDISLSYAKKAYDNAVYGIRNKSVRYRNQCYKQMLKCCDYLEYANEVLQEKKETHKWRIRYSLALIAWGISKGILTIADLLIAFRESISVFFKRYGWRILQLLYIAWLAWLLCIIFRHYFC